MIISFSGPSGSGKTTVIENTFFQDYFGSRKVNYVQEDKFFLLGILKQIAGRDKIGQVKNKAIHENKVNRGLRYNIMILLYSCVVYFEFWAKYIYYEILFPRKIVVMDRYIYDYLVTLRVNLGVSSKILSLLFRNFPKPYLSFYVGVDLRLLQSRNKNAESPVVSSLDFQKKVLENYTAVIEEKSLIKVAGDLSEADISEEILSYLKDKEKLINIGEVVIIGLDGSGKSTLCENFNSYLNRLGVRSRLVHFYHDYILYKFLKRVGYYNRKRGHLTEEDILEKSRQHNIEAKKAGRSFLWGFLHFADSWVQYLFFKVISLNRFIIFDRYFYDFLVSFSYLNVPSVGLFEKFIPDVKNKFFLECPPELCYLRKPENTIEFFKGSYNLYREVAEEHNLKIIKSTRGDPEKDLHSLLDKLEE